MSEERLEIFNYFQDNHCLVFFDSEIDDIISHLINPHKERIAELEAENAELVKHIKRLLFLFDRGLPTGSIGRRRCDEAKQAIEKAEKING